ncbi:P-loop containing nucleoside triphosphate hydrolase protein [Aspergillus heterothallicus]
METPPDNDWVALDLDRIGDKLGLQTSRTSARLNQIDRIRANGLVCGDQSAGKSSVLEGITGIPFPRQDGLCTRFATEISLRHQPGEQRATAMIIPHVSRSEEERERLGAFRRQIHDFTEIPNIIEEASALMGLRGHTADLDAPAFSADILRLELIGNTGLHLTIVDLPGLISVSENEEDVKLVRDLVDSYLENSRTIILAVVPASSDVDTQGILQRARHFDQAGCRTVGIFTKPDLINAGTESRVARLAKNMDNTKLNMGFFLLKNPTPAQLEKGITLVERRKAELDFFSTGLWKNQGIESSRVGIDNLRVFLQELLDSHIEKELPEVREDELGDLGEERSSPSQIRVYLTKISSDFQNLIKAGLEGAYNGCDASFFVVDGKDMIVRLRAAVHKENESFASYMRQHSEKRKVVAEMKIKNTAEAEEDQILLTNKQMMSWIERTRAELYHAQSERWGSICRRHVDTIVSKISRFFEYALKFVVKDSKVRQSVSKMVKAGLDLHIQHAYEELGKLLEDETRQPITYNHCYTDNIQKARLDRSKEQLTDVQLGRYSQCMLEL